VRETVHEFRDGLCKPNEQMHFRGSCAHLRLAEVSELKS
jgi:hypothetical protein